MARPGLLKRKIKNKKIYPPSIDVNVTIESIPLYLKLNFDNLFKILVLYLISIGGKEKIEFFRSN
jgi:hypothetical protein